MNTLCCNAEITRSEQRKQTAKAIRKTTFAGSLCSLVASTRHWIEKKYNQRINRQAFNYLLTLDDNLLKDIGVTRQDVQWASQLPLEEDAATKIEQIARRR